MNVLSLLALCAGTAVSGPEIVTLSAELPSAELTAGSEHELKLELTVADGWSVADAGIPVALLQVEAPASITLLGEATRQHKSEFIDMPHERPIQPGSSTLGFKVSDTPGADDRLALNLIAYVKNTETAASDFVRLRLELALRPGAKAAPTSAKTSTWGPAGATLQVGDRADAFTLSRADGTTVSLADYKGKKNVLITTYRAFW